jgi:hypothetical protein
MKTTLNEIKKYNPCDLFWNNLLDSLNKTEADDEPLSIIYIMDNNSLEDALFCLQAVKGHDKAIWTYAISVAKQSIHLQSKHYVNDYWKKLKKFVKGNISEDELKIAFILAFTNPDINNISAAHCLRIVVNWVIYEISKDASRKASKEAAWQSAWGAFPNWDNVHAARREEEQAAYDNVKKEQEHYFRMFLIKQK